MADKKLSKILKKAGPIPAEEIPRLFEMLLECEKESELTEREIKKYDSIKEVMIKEITGKYSFYESLFTKIFAERRETIEKDFEIIDEGMKRNDRELIAAGVAGLSQIVGSSPFTDMDKLRHLLASEKRS